MARNLASDKRVIMIDDDLKIVEYSYTFIDGIDGENDRMVPVPKERGWETISTKRKRIKVKHGHTWKTRYILEKKSKK